MSHSIFTNLGSNQDADDYRNQAVNREREAAPILSYCSWHFGGKGSWFDRATGKAVASDQKAVSHGICPACSAQRVEIARKNREALPKSDFKVSGRDFRQDIFNYFSENHGLTLTESEMVDIEHVVNKKLNERISSLLGENTTLNCAITKAIQCLRQPDDIAPKGEK